MEKTIFLLALVMTAAFAANVPLGYLRQSCRKFSLGWFVYVHISIPLIIIARHTAGLGWQFIPLTLVSTVAGQVIGGRANRKRHDLG